MFVCPQPTNLIFRIPKKVYLFCFSEFSYYQLEQNRHFNSYLRHLNCFKTYKVILKSPEVNPHLDFFLKPDKVLLKINFISEMVKKRLTNRPFFKFVWKNIQLFFALILSNSVLIQDIIKIDVKCSQHRNQA